MSSADENKASQGFELPRPGKEHKLLEPFIGKFRATVKLFMGGPEPQTSTGTMTNSWQVDGLYMHQDYLGDPAPPPFPAFVGRGYWGYNFGSGRFEGFWIDNASSLMQVENGQVDASGKVWTMLSEFLNPRDGRTIKRRSVIRLNDPNSHTMESFMTGPDGAEHLTMSIDYRRV